MGSYYVADFCYSAMQATIERVEELLKQLGSIKAVAASLEVDEIDVIDCLKWGYRGWDKISDKVAEAEVFYKSPPRMPIVYNMDVPDYPPRINKCIFCPMEDLDERTCGACPDFIKAWEKKKSGRTAG